MDLNAATREALLEMIDHLERTYGFERPAAYALCSAAVDLRVPVQPEAVRRPRSDRLRGDVIRELCVVAVARPLRDVRRGPRTHDDGVRGRRGEQGQSNRGGKGNAHM